MRVLVCLLLPPLLSAQISDAVPARLESSTPAHGQSNVPRDRATSLLFSRGLDPSSIGGAAVVVQDEFRFAVPDVRSLSSDGRALTLRYPNLLPVGRKIRVHVDGSLLRDVHGIAIDADGDGRPGGTRLIEFFTLPAVLPVEEPKAAVILGRVFDAATPPQPLAGAEVRAYRWPRGEHDPPLLPAPAFSNAQGEFAYTTPEFFGTEHLLVQITKADHSEALREVTILAGRCWRVDDARLMPLTPTQHVPKATGATLPDPNNPGVVLTIPPDALQQNSDVGVTLLQDGSFLREQLPALVAPGSFVDVRGVFGESTLKNVTLEVPNIYGFPLGTEVPFGKVDHNSLVWSDLRDLSPTSATPGIVKQRGTTTYIEVSFDKFCSICTGYCLPIPTATSVDLSAGASGDTSKDGPGRACGSSVVNLREGFLEETIGLPVLRELGSAFGLTLGYASNTADPSVTLRARTQYGSPRAVEATSYRFRIEGHAVEGFYGKSQNDQEPLGTWFWDGTDGLGRRMPTGSYRYAIQPTSWNLVTGVGVPVRGGRFGWPAGPIVNPISPTVLPMPAPAQAGRVVLIDRRESPYGAGWTIREEPRLWFDADRTIVLTLGTADWRRYTPDPQTQTRWLSPDGDFSTLTHDPLNGAYTRAFRDGTRQEFDALGRVRRVVDRYGHEVRYAHDGNRLSEVISPTGHWIRLSYDTAGKLARIEDSAGRATLFVVDAAGDLTRVTDAAGATRGFAYDARHRLIAQLGARGERSEYDYRNGRVVAARAYDKGGTTLLRERRFDPSALRGEIGEALGQGKGTRADPIPVVEDAVDRVTDGRGVTTRRETNERGQTVLGEDGLGRQTRFDFNPARELVSRTRPNGALTRYAYDAFGNPTRIEELSNPTTVYSAATFEYQGPFDQPSRIVDPEGKQTRFVYDARGSLTKVIDHDNHETVTSYEDPRFPDLPTRVVLPTGDTVTVAYDANGNPEAVTDYPDPIGQPAGRTTRFTYDAAGNLLSVTDPRPETTRYAYDALGRVTSVTDALMRTTRFEYGEQGCGCSTPNLTKVTFANATSIAWAFDGLDRMRTRTDQLGKVSRYDYDAEGNPISATNRNGEVIAYEYDAAGQLVRKTLPGPEVTEYEYDALGDLVEARDANCTLGFGRDFLGRVTKASSLLRLPIRPGITAPFQHELVYTYDRADNRLSMVDAWAGLTIDYAYDNLHRLRTLRVPSLANQTWTYRYDASGRRIAVDAAPGGVRTTYAWDKAGQLTEIAHASTPPLVLRYTDYNPAGQLLRQETVTGTNVLTSDFGYDPLSQLRRASFDQPFGEALVDVTYTYDAANRLRSDSEYVYEWDDEGRMTRRSKIGTTLVEDFTWDAEGVLRGVVQSVEEGGQRVIVQVSRYSYDPLARRIAKSINEVTEHTLYGVEDALHAIDSAGRRDSSAVHGPGIDEPLAVLGSSTGESTFPLQDRIGSVRSLVGSNAVDQYEYDEYGQSIGTSQPNAAGGFSGRDNDLDTGLLYYRARYYHSWDGRFLSEDPLGLRGGLAFYSLAMNNPLNLLDPFGLVASQDPFDSLDEDDLEGMHELASKKQAEVDRWYQELGTARQFFYFLPYRSVMNELDMALNSNVPSQVAARYRFARSRLLDWDEIDDHVRCLDAGVGVVVDQIVPDVFDLAERAGLEGQSRWWTALKGVARWLGFVESVADAISRVREQRRAFPK
jgi:RHS repeat-associated protein